MIEFGMPLLGGILIGLSASLLLLLIGKIAGISGIVWGAMDSFKNPKKVASKEGFWRWLFLFGLILGAWLFHGVSNTPYPTLIFTANNAVLAVIAGLFVGVGVKIGSGCTSGHGVCGIGRLSIRSIVATVTFMLIAIITVLLMRVGGLS